MDIDKISTAEVALFFPRSIEILKRHHLDYCREGRLSFREACKKADADPEIVWRKILDTMENFAGDYTLRLDNWSLPELINFVVQHHHAYIRRVVPEIKQLTQKVCQAHGSDNAELFLLQKHFSELSGELLDQLLEEENVLFPTMLACYQNGQIDPTAADLLTPICTLEKKHDLTESRIDSIRALTDRYAVPSYACPTFRATYFILEQFDTDLTQHIHIENNILFPRGYPDTIL